METLTILTWLATGLIGGVICSLLYGGRRMIVYDLIIGVLGAIAGGWASVIAMGDSTDYLYVISALCGLFTAALALWLFNVLVLRPKR